MKIRIDNVWATVTSIGEIEREWLRHFCSYEDKSAYFRQRKWAKNGQITNRKFMFDERYSRFPSGLTATVRKHAMQDEGFSVEGFFLHERQIDNGRQRRPGARQQCPVSVEDVPPGGRRVHQPNLVFRGQRLVILGWGDLDDPESQEKDPEHRGDDDPDDADAPAGVHCAQIRWLGRRAARIAHSTGAAKITL